MKTVKHSMKQSFTVLLALIISMLAVLPTASVSAADITYLSVVGSWRDPVDNLPGSQPGDPVITNGDPTSTIVWGTTTGQQSGYDFTATVPPPFQLPGPIPFFSLGNFQHRNFEVDDPSLTSVELDVVLMLAVDGVPTGPLTFSFTFNHEETPNNPTPPDTCPYPTPPGEGCTDRVTIVASADPTTFNVGGVDYTLEMSFLDNGNPVDEFITREGGTVNSSGLVGEFTLPPGLRVTKTGPATMRLAEWGNFLLDVQNDGESDAHDVTLLDRFPDGPTGGMCDTTPEVLSAQVFAADGVTPVPGKGPLAEGSDYALAYDGATCELTFVTQSAAAVIGIGERLVISYRTQLDTDSEDGVVLTNLAGATAWFSDDAANPDRISYLRSVTTGTVGVVDHEDAHDVTVDLPELRFEKTVMNVTTGEDPATVATPGDTLRYRLYVENLSDVTVTDFRIIDVLDGLNDPPAFAADTLNVTAAPAGADTTNTDPAGGPNGTGVLDVQGLNIGGLGEAVLIEFEAELAPAIANESFVYNQSALSTGGIQIAVSDDPNVNGQADPNVEGDEDPTQVQIESAPYFNVDKVSAVLDGDPAVLLAGERLRYTITVRNEGTDNAANVVLRDQIPPNVTYMPDSTTLNGAPVVDVNGTTPLATGILINTPSDTTPGAMPVLTDPPLQATATITFDVRVDPDLIDGTIVSNQAFLDAPDANINNIPSDDPRTPEPDDPTVDIVGNVPILFAAKSAVLVVDNDSPGIVDPGDTLRYTITVYNNGTTPLTEARVQDGVPGNTSYVANSTLLNGEPVADVGGAFPLQGILPISSADLTPPLPGVGEGELSPGASATVQFDLLVNADTARGTVISNQAQVYSAEASPLLTDGDGDPTTGPEPTLVLVGEAQQLRINKQVAVVGGGAAEAGDTLEYLVRITNSSPVPAYDVVIQDYLDDPVPGQLTFVADSATLNGNSNGVTIVDTVLTVNYSDLYGPLQPGEEIQVRFRAVIEPTLPIGTTVINRAQVIWNTDQMAAAEVRIDVGGVVGTGILTGTAWHDTNFDNQQDGGEQVLPGWRVDLYRNDAVLLSTVTDGEGVYLLQGVPPNYLTPDIYRLTFTAPDAGPSAAKLGLAYSEDFENRLQEIYAIEVRSGSNLINLDMPIDPNGVVYNALIREPLAGVTLTLVDAAGVVVPEVCFDDPNQQGQTTTASGFYKFDLNFDDAGCPSGEVYRIVPGAPNSTFVQDYSELIPPASTPATPLDVPACPLSANDAVPATDAFCEVQASPSQPGVAAAFDDPQTVYYAHLIFNDSDVPGSSQVFNNHLPIDPVLTGVVTVSKTTTMVDVQRGQLVPYTLRVGSNWEIDLAGINVIDRFPPGFHYVPGSARLDGEPLEPEQTPRELIWRNLTLDAEGTHTIELLLGVGAGIAEGEYINRAYAALDQNGAIISGEGTATVRLVPDPTMDCTDVTGKVFDDDNRNGVQDEGELGIAQVQVVTPRGLAASTDAHGRFHITCPIIPNESRGSNFVLKLDDRTLPSGYRASTGRVQVKRATRGKSLNFSFGASIHRVVGLDIADPVFVPDNTGIRPQWEARFGLLIEELEKHPAVLRLSYLADTESEKLVKARLRALKKRIGRDWRTAEADYRLEIETQVFWRMGREAEKAVSAAGGRTP